MAFWLKQSVNPKYTIQQINYYPCGIWATQIISALGFAWVSDYVLKGRRWPPLIFVGVRVPHPTGIGLMTALALYDMRPSGWYASLYR